MKLAHALAFMVVVGCGGGAKSGPKTTDPTPDPGPAAVPDQPAPNPGDAKPKSLYDRFGGLDGITAVVDEFVDRTTADAAIKHRFFNTDAVQLEKLLVEFVCMATGGPCKYTGRDMQSSHAGMQLVEEEFNALVGDLVAALEKFEVPEK